jgi:ABC-type lipoprotein release transport system permease subunit
MAKKYKVKKGQENKIIMSKIGAFKLADKISQYKLKELFKAGYSDLIEEYEYIKPVKEDGENN